MSVVGRALDLRRGVEHLLTALFRPSLLDAALRRNDLNTELRSHWPGRSFKAYELILEDWDDPSETTSNSTSRPWPQFVVFIDDEYDVDWFTDVLPTTEACGSVAKAEAIGARRCKHLPLEQLLEFRRLVGLAIAEGIRGCSASADKLTQDAAAFLESRTIERSRSWTLSSAHVLALLTSTILWIVWSFLQSFVARVIQDGQLVPIAIQGAILGSYLSVIQKAGKGSWDAASGQSVHFLEVLTKFTAGAICGVVAFVLSRWTHAPSSIVALGNDAYSLFLFGVAVGFVERLIPKIITAYSDSTESRKEE